MQTKKDKQMGPLNGLVRRLTLTASDVYGNKYSNYLTNDYKSLHADTEKAHDMDSKVNINTNINPKNPGVVRRLTARVVGVFNGKKQHHNNHSNPNHSDKSSEKSAGIIRRLSNRVAGAFSGGKGKFDKKKNENDGHHSSTGNHSDKNPNNPNNPNKKKPVVKTEGGLIKRVSFLLGIKEKKAAPVKNKVIPFTGIGDGRKQ